MWDDHDRDDPADETAESSARRRKEEPLDLPLGRESGAVVPRPAPAPVVPRKKKGGAPLFPDWAPEESPERPRDRGLSRGVAVPSFGGIAPPLDGDDDPIASAGAPLAARAFAGMVDLALVVLIGAVLVLAVRLVVGVSLPRAATIWTVAFAVELALVAAILSQFLFGRTPGMALAAIRAEEPDGMPIRFRRAVIRVLASAGGILLPGVGLLVAAVREDRRSLTDLASGTVLRESDLPMSPIGYGDDER